MTTYNSTSVHHAALLIETNGRGEGAAFVALGGNLKRENVKTAIAIFDSLERAPWWEEIGSDYRFGVNEPCRLEGPVTTVEALVKDGGPIGDGLEPNERIFRDTRWTPPPPPPAVGDVIKTEEDLERLPEETLLFSTRLHTYWMEKEGHFIAIGSDRWLVADEAASYGPFTIRWLPEPEATE